MNHESILSAVRPLAECFTSFPDDLRFTITEGERVIEIEISGHRDDTQKLLGKEGRNAQLIENVAGILTERLFKECHVEIAEGWTGRRGEAARGQGELFTNTLTRRLGQFCRQVFKSSHILRSGTADYVVLEVVVGEEPPPELAGYLRSIFKAYGKMHDKVVVVRVVKEVLCESATP